MPRTFRRSHPLRIGAISSLLATLAVAVPIAAHASGPTSLHVNFAAHSSTAPAGHVNDHGLAFSAATGMGWENATTGAATSLVGNGRERDSSLSPDKRYDTLVAMQQTVKASSGTQTPGRWEHVLASGTYSVTVAVGDATATNSTYRITAEFGTTDAVVIINNVVPTAAHLFATVTKQVTVIDGRLTLDANGGGVNTKIDFVDAVPVTATTPPGAPTTLTATAASGQATVTWAAPTSNGGRAITGYTVTAAPGGATATTSGATTATVSGLTNGTAYTFAVTARNSAGVGPASTPSVAVTPAARTLSTYPKYLTVTGVGGAVADVGPGGDSVPTSTVVAAQTRASLEGGIFNDSHDPLQVVVFFGADCFGTGGEVQYTGPALTLTVPGDPALFPGQTVMARVQGTITLPAGCNHNPTNSSGDGFFTFEVTSPGTEGSPGSEDQWFSVGTTVPGPGFPK